MPAWGAARSRSPHSRASPARKSSIAPPPGGLAIRVAQRLSGGLAGPLQRSRLSADQGTVTLHLPPEDRALYGETVERRHAALATFLNRLPILSA
jgi:exopolyphosphatase/guanosine-5'-triphosphate,3'-diphosphate pyrophosphatase